MATEVEPNFCAADVHPGGGKVCVKAYGLVQKTYNPNRVADADEAHQSEEGARRGSGIRADLVGRSARPRSPPNSRASRAAGLTDESGYPRGRREFRWRRHAAVVHGHVPRVPRRVGAGGHGFRLGAGRQVLPLRASVRRILAPRVHRLARHAAVQLSHLLRRQRRSLRRRGRRLAPCQGARPRHEARAGRAASVGHRRVLGRMGADQAQDRRRVPVRADARAAARSPARAARSCRSSRQHTSSPYLVGANGFFLRDRARGSRWCGTRARHRAALRRARHRRGARRQLRGRPIEIGPDDEVLADGMLDGETVVRQARLRTCAAIRRNGRVAICDVPAATIRRIAQRVSRSRAGRRDDRDRRQDAAVPAGSGEPRQDGQQWLGRLRVLLGPHHAGDAGRRARSAGRHAGHDGAAEPAGARRAGEREARPRRFHGVSAQSDRQGALAPEPKSATRTGRWCRSPPDGPWSQALGPTHFSWMFLDETPQGPAARHAARSLVRLPHQSRRSRSGTPTRSARRWRASRSSSPSPTRATRPTMWPTYCCPRPPTSKACS